MSILGLDIGGANIKAADDSGFAVSRSFAIWKHRERLQDEIVGVLKQFPAADRVVVTMTAELADCFATKTEGVRCILDAVDQAAQQVYPTHRESVEVWSTGGRFVSSAEAREQVFKVAAANWHALATWCGKLNPAGSSLLVDIGTTTTDIIPLVDGRPVSAGFTDVERLQSGELSYSGVWRTPLCAVAHSVPFRTGYCSLAAELFATTLDVYLLLDQISEDQENLDTANGRAVTKSAAHDRIARILCCDRDEVSLDEAIQIARFLADVQRLRLAGALERVVHRMPSDCQHVVISGSGSFLARQLIYENRHTTNARITLLADRFSLSIAESACAYAIAQLATASQ